VTDLDATRKADSAWISGRRDDPIAGVREGRDEPLTDKTR
jgi:hypothetical protein